MRQKRKTKKIKYDLYLEYYGLIQKYTYKGWGAKSPQVIKLEEKSFIINESEAFEDIHDYC